MNRIMYLTIYTLYIVFVVFMRTIPDVRLGVNNQVDILRQMEKNSKAFWCQYQIYVGYFRTLQVLHVQQVHMSRCYTNFNYAVKTHREQTQSHISTLFR